jgi:hypothetical protein
LVKSKASRKETYFRMVKEVMDEVEIEPIRKNEFMINFYYKSL